MKIDGEDGFIGGGGQSLLGVGGFLGGGGGGHGTGGGGGGGELEIQGVQEEQPHFMLVLSSSFLWFVVPIASGANIVTIESSIRISLGQLGLAIFFLF